MSDTELKSAKLAATLNISEKMTVDADAGIITLADDFYESTLPEGLTLDVVKKIQKHDSGLMAATTYAAGERAAELYKANPELKEVSFKYSHGLAHTSGFFNREGTTPVRNVVESYGSSNRGELGKVYKHVKSLFDDINS